ncbi:MAG: hypothetical protein PQJ58_21105 [Spirochaetales bacterium]|nr:hypothetical protein [Spirochaetales bacterium]
MNRFLYINGSPRGEKGSSSALILEDIREILKQEGGTEEQVQSLTLPRKTGSSDSAILKKMEESDVWILALPLYIDVLPGHLTWWLREYQTFREALPDKKNIRVYGVVNCGFPEAVQNADALRVLKLFCRKSGLEWRFGIGLGMGEPYKQMHGIPLQSGMKKEILNSYKAIAADLQKKDTSDFGDFYVRIRYPKFLYKIQGAFGWVFRARQNGLKKRDLYARPLLEA